MFGRQAFLPAAFAAIVGTTLFVAGCAKPGGTTGPTCSGDQISCGQGCTEVATDSQNCGTCGTVCKSGQTCQSGTCTCGTGLLNCSGSCVSSSSTNCGTCGTACTGTQVCSNGTCASSCATGTTQCSGGTCANTMTDNLNCGTCNTACSGGTVCTAGSCTCSVAGQVVCSGTCTDTNTSNGNCGTCGHACTGGQTCANGTCTGGGSGAAGTNGSGAAGTNGSGAAGTNGSGAAGTNGSGAAGTNGSGAAGTNGSGAAGTNGSGTAGTTGTGGSSARACAAASADVVSDFEDGTGDEVVQGGRQGWWYVFADTNGGSQTPASNASGPVVVAAAAAPLPTGDTATCDKWAMHSTATGHTASNTANYEGFGVSLAQIIPPPASGSKTKNPYDVTAYDGISFNIKAGSGTAPPIWFELGNTETEPAPDGTAVNNAVDEYNTRGKLLSNIGTTWTTVYVPFGLLAPRYLPNLTESQCSSTSVNCQAPAWNPKSLLGLQFAVYPQFSTSTLNYDLWVDDVTLYTGTNGLATVTATGSPAHPFPVDGTVGSCTKPTGALGKYLADMYTLWKSTFVTGSGSSTRIQRPENGNDTVSEGIGYGMMIAADMGDKTLFDGLWSYEQAHLATGNLMTWCIPSGGGSCSATGGSATDADEDMAFALIEAGKQWGGTYAATAKTMIGQIWTSDIDASSLLPTGGSNYGSTSSKPTNPSYFAPAFYRVFATVDTGHAWGTVVTNVYAAIAKVANGSGLIPAWCSNNCSAVGTNGGADDGVYQYDAHRVPWRIGTDACWNKSSLPPSGMTFLTNSANFFSGKAATGIGRLVDIYTLSGSANGDAAPNSMSLVGTAGVGAMAVGNSFMNTAYRFLLDATYTPASRIPDSNGKIAYTYFNATVGLLSALTMSGNFQN